MIYTCEFWGAVMLFTCILVIVAIVLIDRHYHKREKLWLKNTLGIEVKDFPPSHDFKRPHNRMRYWQYCFAKEIHKRFNYLSPYNQSVVTKYRDMWSSARQVYKPFMEISEFLDAVGLDVVFVERDDVADVKETFKDKCFGFIWLFVSGGTLLSVIAFLVCVIR